MQMRAELLPPAWGLQTSGHHWMVGARLKHNHLQLQRRSDSVCVCVFSFTQAEVSVGGRG